MLGSAGDLLAGTQECFTRCTGPPTEGIPESSRGFNVLLYLMVRTALGLG
jgi:hypothetical protein